MIITYRQKSGDVSVQVPLRIEEGETFQEGSARYQVTRFTESDGTVHVVCKLTEGHHPFWWAHLAQGDEITFAGDFLARTLHEKRAFGFSSQSI